MRLFLIVAVMLAVLMCSTAEAKLFDRLRNRPKPVPLAVTVVQDPVVETQEVVAPNLRRLRPLERLKAFGKLRAAMKKLRVPK